MKLNTIKFISIFSGTLFLLFSLFHAVALSAVPMHQHSGADSQHVTSAVSCIRQCTVLSKDSLWLQTEAEQEKDPVTSFTSLLAVVSISSSIFYLFPSLLIFVKRKLKVPLYKQIACYRI